jgi:hypothetical protein
MKIRIIGQTGEAVMPLRTSGPWLAFSDQLISSSNEIVQTNFGQKIDALIANSYSSESIAECEMNDLPKKRRVLVLWEPRINNPKTYSKKILENYGKIYTPSVDWAKKIEAEFFNWPQLDLKKSKPSFSNWNSRENKAVVVLANKFSASKGELYSLRRGVAYHSQNDGILDLFGDKWNSGPLYDLAHYLYAFLKTPLKDFDLSSNKFLMKKYNSYKGFTTDKILEMSKYRISLVMENSGDYVSEKLFDSVSSGAITIYVGPNIEKYGLDKKSVIQCNPDVTEIINTIKQIQSISVGNQLKMAKLQYISLLKSADKWDGKEVLKDLAVRINRYLKTTTKVST